MAREEKTRIEDQIERISTIFKTVSEKNVKYTVKDIEPVYEKLKEMENNVEIQLMVNNAKFKKSKSIFERGKIKRKIVRLLDNQEDIKNLFIVYDEFVKRASPEK